VRYAHLLSGEPASDDQQPPSPVGRVDDASGARPAGPTVEDLQRQIDELRAEFDAFRKQFG
jgi:hypothetical protein